MPGRTLTPKARRKLEAEQARRKKENLARMTALLSGSPAELKLLVCESCGREYPVKPESEKCECGSFEFYFISGKKVYLLDFDWSHIERCRTS